MVKHPDNTFGILMYHRVAPWTPGVARPTWNVTPKQFRKQLEGLLTLGHRPWPLRRAIECHASGEPIPAGAFVVTFDDGYECVYKNAWPILKEMNVPATIFVTTSYLDAEGPFASDDWMAAGSTKVSSKSWRPLATPQCAEMIAQGLVEVGSHTHAHADYRGRSEEFRDDLIRSFDILMNRLGVERPSFAFPYGRFDAEMIKIVKDLGGVCALNTRAVPIDVRNDPFDWGRFCVEEDDTPRSLSWKLDGRRLGLQRFWRWMRRPSQVGRAIANRLSGLPAQVLYSIPAGNGRICR